MNLTCQNQRQRKILNLLNFSKPDGYYFATKELEPERLIEVEKTVQKEIDDWKIMKAANQKFFEKNEVENVLGKKQTIIGGFEL